MGLGGFKLELIWKSNLQAQTVIELEDAMQEAKKVKQIILTHRCDADEPQQWPAWQGSPKNATVALMYSE